MMKTKKCRKCGFVNTGDSSYCVKCGKKLKSTKTGLLAMGFLVSAALIAVVALFCLRGSIGRRPEPDSRDLSKMVLELAADDTHLYLGEEGRITLTVRVPSDLEEGEVTIHQADGKKIYQKEISEMSVEGDQRAETFQVELDTEADHIEQFTAKAGDLSSPALSIYITPRITLDQVVDSMDIEYEVDAFIEKNHSQDSLEKKIKAAKRWLEEDPRIKEVLIDEATATVAFITKDCVGGAHSPVAVQEPTGYIYDDVTGLNDGSSDSFSSDSELSALYEAYETEQIEENNMDLFEAANHSFVCTNPDVLLLIPTPAEMGTGAEGYINTFTEACETIQNATEGRLDVLRDSEAVNAILSKEMNEYGTVVLFAHGVYELGKTFYMVGKSPEFSDDNKKDIKQEIRDRLEAYAHDAYENDNQGTESYEDFFSNWYSTSELGIFSSKIYIFTAGNRYELRMSSEYIMDRYQSEYFDNTIMYIASCFGLRDDDFDSFLINRGCRYVFGYADSIKTVINSLYFEIFAKSMTKISDQSSSYLCNIQDVIGEMADGEIPKLSSAREMAVMLAVSDALTNNLYNKEYLVSRSNIHLLEKVRDSFGTRAESVASENANWSAVPDEAFVFMKARAKEILERSFPESLLNENERDELVAYVFDDEETAESRANAGIGDLIRQRFPEKDPRQEDLQNASNNQGSDEVRFENLNQTPREVLQTFVDDKLSIPDWDYSNFYMDWVTEYKNRDHIVPKDVKKKVGMDQTLYYVTSDYYLENDTSGAKDFTYKGEAPLCGSVVTVSHGGQSDGETSATYEPVENALVTAYVLRNRTFCEVETSITNSNGEFIFDSLPMGHLILVADKGKSKSSAYSIYLVDEERDDGSPWDGGRIFISLYDIRGRVIDADTRTPLSGVEVSCKYAGDQSQEYTVETDEDGYYLFSNLSQGTVDITADCAGYEQGQISQYSVSGNAHMIEMQDIELERQKGPVLSAQIAEYKGTVYSVNADVPEDTFIGLPVADTKYDGIISFAFYNNRIYYCCKEAGTSDYRMALFSCNMDGTDVREIMDEDSWNGGYDLYRFLINDGALWVRKETGIYNGTGSGWRNRSLSYRRYDLRTEEIEEFGEEDGEDLLSDSKDFFDFGDGYTDGEKVFRLERTPDSKLLENRLVAYSLEDNNESMIIDEADFQIQINGITRKYLYYSKSDEDSSSLWRLDLETDETLRLDSRTPVGNGWYFAW